MTSTSSPPAGQSVVPIHRLDSILDALTQVAGQLEQTCSEIQAAVVFQSGQRPVDAPAHARIRQALSATAEVGDEAFTVAEVTEAVAAMLAEDEGTLIPASVIRPALPKLMLELFGAKLSCSIRRGDRFARGWRRIAPKTVETPDSQPTP